MSSEHARALDASSLTVPLISKRMIPAGAASCLGVQYFLVLRVLFLRFFLFCVLGSFFEIESLAFSNQP